MRQELPTNQCSSAVMAFGIACVLLAGSVEAAVGPQGFLGLVSHRGVGRHPIETRVRFFIEDSDAVSKLFCFAYSITTKKKIRGRIDIDIDVINADGVRRLATLGTVAIEELETADPDPDNPCAPLPRENLDVNFGGASECLFITEPLREGDVVRFSARFQRPAKLKGPLAGVTSLGQVITDPVGGSITLLEAENLVLNEAVESLAEDRE